MKLELYLSLMYLLHENNLVSSFNVPCYSNYMLVTDVPCCRQNVEPLSVFRRKVAPTSERTVSLDMNAFLRTVSLQNQQCCVSSLCFTASFH